MVSSTDPTGVIRPRLDVPRRRINGRDFDFAREVAVMAVINRTPDSFYDQGATFALDQAVAAAHRAIDDGADWVDIGGAKFAPGPAVPVAEEIDRVVPVVAALRGTGVVISVDTFDPDVAKASINAGAHVINDTTGVHDPRMAEVVADSDATLVITHSLARPRTPYPAPQYTDVAAEVSGFLQARVQRALDHGMPADRLVIDPGHDLNKNTRHSLELTRRLAEITTLGLPTLVAVSNKDFIGETLDRGRDQRVEGTLAAVVYCIMQGARIVRVHNVAAAVDAVRMTEAILGWREPAYLRHNLT
ncbi:MULTISPECIES: dihydropteroate synthase [unclassified Cryobacterium]|uniref:dihydropteroate synthase n=1 Tax=unclassified Cryobacterium TaxID=2649013 RepID=UPI001068E02F|nr:MULTISPECIES: dihydropteroate synthase [unclassified Cryobacterium]TFC54011.1 dihydropteroate synthase [Cryobacterium sp. TMB3-1-2]TFC73701.1 dihydropteroate synthase [Cryobacterium sp. TMB3-15]TFC77767.1 dihydropteroate synthase [Cryobacterium sp. TMB3-10]TFD43072.1 dihydropteroate synthase [Cryobacterium sp. TMB3-12]